MTFRRPQLARIAAFIESIGIAVHPTAITHSTLVPGVDIRDGALIVDEDQLLRDPDIIHEAGHLAITPRALRRDLYGKISSTPADEVTTIAWTWAAALHLGIAPGEVFHELVISGNGPTLRENFENGHYVGVPMLQRWGMTKEYPVMLRWTRD